MRIDRRTALRMAGGVGIWSHWGPQSAIGDGDWYARLMYMEGSPHLSAHSHEGRVESIYNGKVPWKIVELKPVFSIANGELLTGYGRIPGRLTPVSENGL